VKVFRVETLHDAAYEEIVSLLRDGGIIAFPTDTAYGLGVDPFNQAAVNRVFQIKGRPETKPILLIVDSPAMAETVCRPSGVFYDVVQRFWPGPLTTIVAAAASVPESVTAGTKTIGLRWPIAPFATALVNRFGKPITATSANRSGHPSPVTAEEVRAQFGEGIDALIDGGMLPARGGSTVLDLTADPPVLLREGPISFAAVAEFFKGRIRRQVA
jgi:L-threonylcarbamoyladenylate synthase